MRRQQIQTADLCLRLAEQGVITPASARAIGRQVPLSATAAEWRWLLGRLLLLSGVLLLLGGIIFFFAWNWAALARGYKLSLALGLLTVFAAAAWSAVRRPQLQSAMLLACCLMAGALLALIGQQYQSGADIWQLFAFWALLILPWVWYSGSRACWLLLWLLTNLALWRYFAAAPRWSPLLHWQPHNALLCIALANLCWLWLFERFALRGFGLPGRWLMRASGLAMLGSLTLAAVAVWWDSSFLWPALLLPFLLVPGVVLYRWLRPDLFLLALQGFSLIAVSSSALAALLEHIDTFFFLNTLGIYVIGTSAGLSVWLHRLHREGV